MSFDYAQDELRLPREHRDNVSVVEE